MTTIGMVASLGGALLVLGTRHLVERVLVRGLAAQADLEPDQVAGADQPHQTPRDEELLVAQVAEHALLVGILADTFGLRLGFAVGGQGDEVGRRVAVHDHARGHDRATDVPSR